jgi:hypothetical protein
MPGPRSSVFDMSPKLPSAGKWNTLVSKLREKVLSPGDRTGFPITRMRGATLGVPLRSTGVT